MQNILFAYFDLSPKIKNKYDIITHKIFRKYLETIYLNWKSVFEEFNDYSIGFDITTDENVKEIITKGPKVSKKTKVIRFTILLPSVKYSLEQYIDYIFEGIMVSLKKYKINEEELIDIKNKCKNELGVKVLN